MIQQKLKHIKQTLRKNPKKCWIWCKHKHLQNKETPTTKTLTYKNNTKQHKKHKNKQHKTPTNTHP